MKRFLIPIFLLILISYAAAPSRPNSYSAGDTILSSEVNSDFDTLYNYLTAGVDTYKSLSIVNADVNAAANIQSDKLNLTSIAQAVLINSSGSLEVDGTTQFDGTVALNAKLTAGANEIEGSAFDINGGAVDGAVIGGASAGAITGTTINADTSFEAASGAAITEFSTDDTLGGDSDAAVPTEQAVKAYVDGEVVYTIVESKDYGGSASTYTFSGLTTGVQYKIVYRVNGAGELRMQFNGDTAGDKHKYAFENMDLDGTPNQTATGDDTENYVPVCPANAQASTGEILLTTSPGDSNIVVGTYTYTNANSHDTGYGGFEWDDSDDLTNIVIYDGGTNNITGTITIYVLGVS